MALTILLLQAGAGAKNQLGLFLPMILMFVVLYLFILRPQAKRQKQTQRMLTELKQGDGIVTIGGIHGTIAGIREKENLLIVKINDTVKVEFDRSAVARVISKADGSDIVEKKA